MDPRDRVASPWALLRADLGTWWRFSRPVAVLRAEWPYDVPPLLGELEAAARGGLWGVGFVTYESAAAFDRALITRGQAPGVPAAWFALFERPDKAAPPAASTESGRARFALSASVSEEEYLAGVAAIREAIARGETYQANWTYRLRGSLAAPEGGASLPPLELFARLRARQDAPYAAFLDLGGPAGARDGAGAAVCSVSPELFFSRRGRTLLCRPMKGTAPRGRSAEEDLGLAEELRRSPKEQAENLMIVDMVRNDLGRIARPGSVRVRRLFAVERYATVQQMTSEVDAESDAGLAEVFAALFPSASVTGAPKVRTMELLAALETTPRGLYTGAIGYVAPGGEARFSVAIRTAWIDRGAAAGPSGDGARSPGEGDEQGPWLEYGTGGGIVWDSDPARELAETRTKALVLVRALEGRPVAEPALRLLETILWRPDTGFALIERHLARLAASAAELGFALDLDLVRRRLAALASELDARSRPRRRLRVRLLAGPAGELALEARPLEPLRRPWTVALAADPVDRRDPCLRHKTTRRELYERALGEARARTLREVGTREAPAAPALDDVLLWNREGELTESTVANLVLRLDGRLVTPPAASGLLPGTLRAELLARGRVEEQALTVADLARAEAIYLVNSLRGWIPARLVPSRAPEPPPRIAGNRASEVPVARVGIALLGGPPFPPPLPPRGENRRR